MQIFDEIKACGVEDVLFISVYGASGLKAAEAEVERFKQAWSRIPGPWMYGYVTGSMWKGSSTIGARYAK